MIINAEIQTVYVAEKYPDELAEKLLAEAGVELILFNTKTGEMKKLV